MKAILNKIQPKPSTHLKRFWLFWGIQALLLILIQIGLHGYDSLGNDDNVLASISLIGLFQYGWTAYIVFFLLSLGIRSGRPIISNITFSIASLLFTWLALEIVSWAALKLGVVTYEAPTHARLFVNFNQATKPLPFWGDYDEHIPRWRLPFTSHSIDRCDGRLKVTFNTNAHGARDTERTVTNTTGRPRTLVLGDSFIEGFMVNTPSRLSNLLEARTKREHLNFGENGTAPIEYYLTYKWRAKQFQHDVVLVGILPANDFEIMNRYPTHKLVSYPIYRPYWVEDSSGYRLVYSLSSRSQSIASQTSYNKPVQIYNTTDSLYSHLSILQKLATDFHVNSYLFRCVLTLGAKLANRNPLVCWYTEPIMEELWRHHAHSLACLIREARGKRVVLFTIPILNDLRSYKRTQRNELAPRYAALCRQYGAQYVDLLPYFAGYKGNPEDLYVMCDGHWSEKGEALAADVLAKTVYQE